MTATAPMLLPLREREWQEQVCTVAQLYHWSWVHLRAARTVHGWRTPVSGPLGAGFVDLVLVSPARRRVLYVELKSDAGKLSPEQREVHEVLRAAGCTVEVWRPRDWDRVLEVLQR